MSISSTCSVFVPVAIVLVCIVVFVIQSLDSFAKTLMPSSLPTSLRLRLVRNCTALINEHLVISRTGCDAERRGAGVNLLLTPENRQAETVQSCILGSTQTQINRARHAITFLSKVVAEPCCLRQNLGDRTVWLSLSDSVCHSPLFVKELRQHGIPTLALDAAALRTDVIMIPDPYFTQTNGHEALVPEIQRLSERRPWHKKRFEVRFRGGAQGQMFGYKFSQRLIIANMSRSVNFQRLNVAVVNTNGHAPDIQQWAQSSGLVRQKESKEWTIKARGVLDIDGVATSWEGCWWKLLSNSVVLKVQSPAANKQWYYDALNPWEHYIPVRADLSDLWDQVDYVLDVKNDAVLQRMATASTNLIKSMTMDTEVAKVNRQLTTFFERN